VLLFFSRHSSGILTSKRNCNDLRERSTFSHQNMAYSTKYRMTPQEKSLYHQIHPLKLLTDSSAEVLSLYLFWKRKLLAGLIVLLVTPVILSTLIITWVDLEAYKQSAFGRYIRASYMTPWW
jgi:hypothetical protein